MRNARLLVLVVLSACGAPQEPQTVAEVTGPFTEEHDAVFDNGLDLVRDPRVLEGQWLTTWEDEVDKRASLADVVAVVTARTLRTDIDPSQRRTYRLIVRVDRALLGERVGGDIELVVREDEAGFVSVDSNEQRLLDQQYLVFIKWAREERAIRARWHLSPATDQVASRVRGTLARVRNVRPDTEHHRVIIHRN